MNVLRIPIRMSRDGNMGYSCMVKYLKEQAACLLPDMLYLYKLSSPLFKPLIQQSYASLRGGYIVIVVEVGELLVILIPHV